MSIGRCLSFGLLSTAAFALAVVQRSAKQGDLRDPMQHIEGGPTDKAIERAQLRSPYVRGRHVRVIKRGGAILLCRNRNCASWIMFRLQWLRE